MRRIRHPRFLLFIAVFIAAAAALAMRIDLANALVLGFDAGALAFVLSTVGLLREQEPHPNRARSQRDDGGRVMLLLVAVTTLVVVAVALGMVILNNAAPTPLSVLIEVGTVILAWLFVNLVYAFHYAHLYYDQTGTGDQRGLNFPDTRNPVFSDFCYFSFVIGMTSQVSDVAVSAQHMRRTVLVQGLIFYVFNFGVIALTINLLASMF